MKVLVTAASKHGSTAEIAEAIGEALTEGGHETSVVPPEEVQHLEGCDAVVLGSAVYTGRWMKPAKELPDRLGTPSRVCPCGCSPAGRSGTRRSPRRTPSTRGGDGGHGGEGPQVFPGKLVKSELGFGEKAIVLALRAPEGDFRDWDEIRAWARGIAEELRA